MEIALSVSELIKRPPVTVDQAATLLEAARVMASNNIGSVIVTSAGEIAGIFTERDLVKAIAAGASLSDRVERYMTRRLITIGHKEPVSRAMELMGKHGIRHLPVVDERGKLIGVISVRDIVEWTRTVMGEKASDIEMGHMTG